SRLTQRSVGLSRRGVVVDPLNDRDLLRVATGRRRRIRYEHLAARPSGDLVGADVALRTAIDRLDVDAHRADRERHDGASWEDLLLRRQKPDRRTIGGLDERANGNPDVVRREVPELLDARRFEVLS